MTLCLVSIVRSVVNLIIILAVSTANNVQSWLIAVPPASKFQPLHSQLQNIRIKKKRTQEWRTLLCLFQSTILLQGVHQASAQFDLKGKKGFIC